MAIIDIEGRWIVVIKGLDGKPVEKSFDSLRRARAWESRRLGAQKRFQASTQSADETSSTTLADLLERYGREVTPQKKGAKPERYRIDKLLRHPMATLTIPELTTKILADYKTERLAQVSSSAVRSELSLIRVTLEWARREWGYDIPENPVKLVTLPPPSQARNRRLEDGEYEKLCKHIRHPIAAALMRFATETGMRRGEILAMRWRHVDLKWRTVHLPNTKNGSPRTVPLTDGAVAVLRTLRPASEAVFPIDIGQLRNAFEAAKRACGVKGLRLHDLRHEAVSRLFEMGLSVPEVQMISGHKTAASLFRYTHLKPRDLARKLKGLKPRGLYDPPGDA